MICPVLRAPLKEGDSDGTGREGAGSENAKVWHIAIWSKRSAASTNAFRKARCARITSKPGSKCASIRMAASAVSRTAPDRTIRHRWQSRRDAGKAVPARRSKATLSSASRDGSAAVHQTKQGRTTHVLQAGQVEKLPTLIALRCEI
jgi:hypothetical protein